MPKPRKPRTARLEGLDEIVTLAEAVEATGLHHLTLRKAIRSGELGAFIPRDRDPLRAGRGLGYRIYRDELRRWYFGAGARPKEVTP